MRVLIRLDRPGDPGDTAWAQTVWLVEQDGTKLPFAPERAIRRRLPRPDAPRNPALGPGRPERHAYPGPPDAECGPLPPDPPLHQALCTTDDVARIARVHRNIAMHDPAPGEVEAYGRYLFATLLGHVWAEVCARAGAEPIELALTWPVTEWELSRLPWELMHTGDHFLAADPTRPVAITREVDGADNRIPMLPSPLRVLFVVGAELEKPQIRAGAEYLGLLRRLERSDKGLPLTSRVLIQATTEDLEDAVAQFEPAVVHFICHGTFDDDRGRASISLLQKNGGSVNVDADQLTRLLRTKQRLPLPSVVVLNACYTAGGSAAAQESVPLAAELVKAGVPIVVGMAGEVADHACRIFTQQFYEALLSGKSVALATAAGRWAGLTHLGGRATDMVDWAFPTLFLAAGAPTVLELDPRGTAAWKARREIAIDFHTITNPPVVFGRHDVLEKGYRELVDGVSGTAKRILAVEVIDWDPQVERPRYGKTRVLEALAARAALDGHVACLVKLKNFDTLPERPLEVAVILLLGILEARQRFGLNGTPDSDILYLVRAELNDGTGRASPNGSSLRYKRAVQEMYQELRTLPSDHQFRATPDIIRDALHSDLKALGQEGAAPPATVLMLIDDVHLLNAAVRGLIAMLGPSGFGPPSSPVPAVLAFSRSPTGPDYSAALTELTRFLESASGYASRVFLRAFLSPFKDPLPYRQFLLHQSPPVVIRRRARNEDIEAVYELLTDDIRGVPSRLEISTENKDVAATIRAAKRLGALEDADDEAMLDEVPGR